MTTRPQFAYARYFRTDEFEGSRWAGSCTRCLSIVFYHSEAGARFAAWTRGEFDDPECYGQVLKLQPGVVYDHDLNKWVDGLVYKAWSGRPQPPVDLDDDCIPF